MGIKFSHADTHIIENITLNQLFALTKHKLIELNDFYIEAEQSLKKI